jgi:pimeloyl-ACP methyl ester carboxylesterase
MKSYRLSLVAIAAFLLAQPAYSQITIRGVGGRRETDKTKNIHGIVQDSAGRPIPGAQVVVRNTKDNTTRLATTDDKGNYSFTGLPADADYEVRANFKGQVSDRTAVSTLLNREDNLVNFKLNIAVGTTGPADTGPELQTFDLFKLRVSFELPRAVPAPIPAVLLFHGFGEDRSVWQGFRAQLLANGFAVMSLDLRGHGQSTTKNQKTVTASPDWRTSPHEFPHDIDPALDWLKAQARLDSRRIVIVGYDIGANMALFASGKFKEVRSVVAIKPSLKESLAMAGSAQDFYPRSALVVTVDEAEGAALKPLVQAPFRLQILPVEGGTAQVFQNKQLTDAILQWVKETL